MYIYKIKIIKKIYTHKKNKNQQQPSFFLILVPASIMLSVLFISVALISLSSSLLFS